MSRHVPISEFKDHASQLFAAVEEGEEIIVTRHGKPVVVMNAATRNAEDREARARAALASMDARRERLRAAGMTATVEEVIAWKNEGQR